MEAFCSRLWNGRSRSSKVADFGTIEGDYMQLAIPVVRTNNVGSFSLPSFVVACRHIPHYVFSLGLRKFTFYLRITRVLATWGAECNGRDYLSRTLLLCVSLLLY